MNTLNRYVPSKTNALLATALLTLAAASPLLAGKGNQSNPGIIPPQASSHGHTYSEWAAKWWQWVSSFPLAQNPNLDPTGEWAALGQEGPVWFLAGNFGGTSDRTITVPPGKALLVPLINFAWVQYSTDPPLPPECVANNYECLREQLRPVMDGAVLSCEIDGVAVQDLAAYREESVVFDVNVPADNMFGAPEGINGPCVDDGYYLLLAPLSAGEHTIHLASSLPDLGFALEITCHITVAK